LFADTACDNPFCRDCRLFDIERRWSKKRSLDSSAQGKTPDCSIGHVSARLVEAITQAAVI
jgi:hypothetical protein